MVVIFVSTTLRVLTLTVLILARLAISEKELGIVTLLFAGNCAQSAKSGISETYANCSPLKAIVVLESGIAGVTKSTALVELKRMVSCRVEYNDQSAG
jgi:hypothetical protein